MAVLRLDEMQFALYFCLHCKQFFSCVGQAFPSYRDEGLYRTGLDKFKALWSCGSRYHFLINDDDVLEEEEEKSVNPYYTNLLGKMIDYTVYYKSIYRSYGREKIVIH